MDIIESVTGKLNLNLGDMSNPNIIIEGIKIGNTSNDSNDSDDEEGEEEEDEEEEEEEEDDDDDVQDEENISGHNLIDDNNDENNNNSNEESSEENNEENSEEGNNEEENQEEEEENEEDKIYNLKKEKFILNLNEFQYKHIKKYSQIKEKKCSICLLKYRGSDIIKEFPCNHIYHKDCILKWLKKSNICPLCKYDITEDVNSIELNKNNNSNNESNEEEEEEEEEEN